jgi:peroxiredoxin Q/BCP
MENIEISVGLPAPDFKLQGSDNMYHSLIDFKGNKIVLYFYPKDNTSG